MANGNIPEWEEWNGLKPEQREYSLFKILGAIERRLGGIESVCVDRHISCQSKFCELHGKIVSVENTVDDSKKKVKYIATGVGVAAAAGALGMKEFLKAIGRWFS